MVTDNVGSVLSELIKERFSIDTIIQAIAQSNHNGDILSIQTSIAECLTHILPMWRQRAISLKLDGKDKTLTAFYLPDVHTLDTDSLSTQLVGYFFSNSLTTVVHDDD